MRVDARADWGTKVVVEITGVSGTGKSYIQRLVAEDLQLARREFPHMEFGPGGMVRALYDSFVKFGVDEHRYKTARRIYSSLRRLDAIGRSPTGLFLIDEGLFQLACVTIGPRSGWDVQRIAKDLMSRSVYRPDAVFSLVVSAPVLEARRRLRGMVPRKTDEREVIRAVETYRQNSRNIQINAEAIGCEFVEIDISDAKGAERARRMIGERMSATRTPDFVASRIA